MTTTETPAAPMPFISGDWKTSRPPSEMATVRPEKTTVRPAESTVRATASTTIERGICATGRPAARARSSSRKRLTTSSP